MGLVFWAAVVLLLHTYFFYPLSLIAWDALRQAREGLRYIGGRERRRRGEGAEYLPTVTLVVAAHNEEAVIAAKLDNSLSIDYPDDRLQVLIGSDGSTDGTEALVASCRDPRVQLSAAPRAGKVAVLNRCIPAGKGEIVVLTDANTMIDKRALKLLVRHFADPEVGAVCGRLRLYNRHRREYEESAYWTYESFIKFYEGKHGAVLGANGGLYAIRRSLFERLAPDTIVDDFIVPLRILEAGYQVLYDPEAVASEETTEDYGQEFSRRARISAGNFQSLRMVPGLLSPRQGFVAYAFWSHKVLRWVAPLLMALALLANLWLLPRGILYQVLLGCQVAFYALALVGSRRRSARSSEQRPRAAERFASVAYYFVSMNMALAVGFWRFLRRSQGAAWNRTLRA